MGLYLLIFACCALKQGDIEERHYYDNSFSNNNYYLHFNFDNYLFGNIKSITTESFSNRNAMLDTLPEMYLNGFTIHHYNLNHRLYKIDTHNQERKYNFSQYNFGKGFNIFKYSNTALIIDSIEMKVIYSENENEKTTYYLDSNFQVKDVKINIIDSSKVSRILEYDKNLIKRSSSQSQTQIYTWDESGRILQSKIIGNKDAFQPNYDLDSRSYTDYTYNRDTILTTNRTSGALRINKLLRITDSSTIPIFKKSSKSNTYYYYNEEYALVKSVYMPLEDNGDVDIESKIIFKYKLDSQSNWINRYDNERLEYTRNIKYDEKGNWTEMVKFENGKKMSQIIRRIEYFN